MACHMLRSQLKWFPFAKLLCAMKRNSSATEDYKNQRQIYKKIFYLILDHFYLIVWIRIKTSYIKKKKNLSL